MFKFFWESIKSGMSMWYGWIVVILTIGGITAKLIKKKFPKVALPRWINKLSIVILALSLFLGIAIGTYKMYKGKESELEEANINLSDLEKKLTEYRPAGFTTPDKLIGPYLEGFDFRIVDLAREDLIIRNRTIVNCRIYGPAVLYYGSGTLGNCIFISDPLFSAEETANSIYLPLPNAKVIQGVIKLENVNFRGCTFLSIAFMGPDELRDMLLQSIK
jgi:hypothetical protein